MNIYIHIIAQITFSLFTFFIIWRLFYFGLYRQLDKVNSEIAFEYLPGVQKSHNLITTLSSGSIVLTFSVIQVLNNSNNASSFSSVIQKSIPFLISSWIDFSVAIISGVMLLVIVFIYPTLLRIQRETTKKLWDEEKGLNKEHSAEFKKLGIVARELLQKETFSNNMLFIFSCLQSTTFILGIINLLIFVIKSILV